MKTFRYATEEVPTTDGYIEFHIGKMNGGKVAVAILTKDIFRTFRTRDEALIAIEKLLADDYSDHNDFYYQTKIYEYFIKRFKEEINRINNEK